MKKLFYLLTLLAGLNVFATVTGLNSASTVVGNSVLLQGRELSSTAPSDTNIIKWNAATSKWEPATNAASTATALAANPSACGAGDFVTDIDADGTLTCDTPAGGTQLTSPTDLQNCSITASVAGNALTVALKDAAGSDPSAGSPCKIAFRSATATSGVVSLVSVTSALSVVVSNGSSLGGTVSVNSNVMVYAVNNAGTVVLAVGRNIYQYRDADIVSTTAEGGAGAADSESVLYSTAAQTSKAARLLGRVQVTPAASFAYSNPVTAVQNMPLPVFVTDWYTCNPSTGGWGGTASYTGKCRRVGDSLDAQFKVSSGSGPTNSTFWIDLPNSMTIDTAKYIHTTNVASPHLSSCMAINSGVANYPCDVLYSNTSGQINARYHTVSGSDIVANSDVSVSAPFTFATGDAVHITISGIPITGWSLYGP
jgi:hypothetical protein